MSRPVEIHRIFKAPVNRVFRAFSDPEALSYWMAPFGFLGKVHHMEFKVGGSYKMSFVNFTNNKSHSFGGEYTEIKPEEVIRYTDRFDVATLFASVDARLACGAFYFT